MTSDTIKEKIITGLKEINDPGLLYAVDNIVRSGVKAGIIKLTPAQIKEIKSSREDIGKDMFIENKLFTKEVREWLKWR
jgi:hypothetical protein